MVVLHDELDLAPGVCRLKTGGGHAGHNGLRSIHQHIGEGYRRLRIGIGHPGHKDRVTGHVLSDFAKAEEGLVDDVLRGISDGAGALAAGDGAAFGMALAARLPQPEPRRPATRRPSGTPPQAQDVPPAPAAAAQAENPPAGPLDALRRRFM